MERREGGKKGREEGREDSSICWFTHMAAMAEAGLGQSQEPEHSSGSTKWVQVSRLMSFHCFAQAHQQGAGLEVENLGLKPAGMLASQVET